MKKTLLCVCAVGIFIWSSGSLDAAPPASATLVVSIAPEAAAVVGCASAWNETQTGQSLQIPLTVVLRLNNATEGLLTLAAAAPAAAGLLVETDSGLIPLSEAPLPIRRFTHSGRFSESVVLHAEAFGSGQFVLQWRLTSSDAAISWSANTALSAPTLLTSTKDRTTAASTLREDK